jgi:hypothetical protein
LILLSWRLGPGMPGPYSAREAAPCPAHRVRRLTRPSHRSWRNDVAQARSLPRRHMPTRAATPCHRCARVSR